MKKFCLLLVILSFQLFSSDLLAQTLDGLVQKPLVLNQTIQLRTCQALRPLRVESLELRLQLSMVRLDSVLVRFGNGESVTVNLFGQTLGPTNPETLLTSFDVPKCVQELTVYGRELIPNVPPQLMLRARGTYQTPVPTPVPTPDYSHQRMLSLGENVFVNDRTAFADVIGFDPSTQSYVVRFTTGPLAGKSGTGWRREQLAVTTFACFDQLCINQPGFNVERNAYVEVVAIEYSGRFVLRFTSGELTGKTGGNWSRDNIAVLQGCASGFPVICVGQKVYNKDRAAEARVVGIQKDGRFVLLFLTGPLTGKTGGNWTLNNLIIIK
jgi:hypothetical protein